jgi:ComF family protein
MRFTLLAPLLDLLLPPRATERAVQALTLDELLTLRAPGSLALPYREERVRALVWEVKYYANRRALDLCGEVLADSLAQAAQESLSKPLLVPMPMHPARRRQRGHNQTELLCEAALAHVQSFFAYEPTALERVLDTRPQQGLPERQRRTNVRRAMRASDSRVRGRHCVVLDDVSTTGASFQEAERALKAAGARSVECIALAHA